MATATRKKRKLALDANSNGMIMTPEEFDAVEDYDENYQYELIHGVVVVNPIPLGTETTPNDLLAYYLNYYRLNHPQGGALDHTMPQQVSVRPRPFLTGMV